MSERLPEGYGEWLKDVKQRILLAQQKAALAVNKELLGLYWHIGNEILERQKQKGWGAKIVTRLSEDLKLAFPDLKGFSRANMMSMRQFAENWPDFQQEPIVQQAVGQIPWGHNLATKSPYIFDFLALGDKYQERELETALIDHISQFLVELGVGFAYVGRQVHLDVGGDDFYIDLLFYHLKLHCYVVVELKAGTFKPADLGQLNFYLTAVDRQVKAEQDAPTIGLLLCRSQNRLVAEYALSDMSKPMGIAEYELMKSLPADLEDKLPSIERIEQGWLDLFGGFAEAD